MFEQLLARLLVDRITAQEHRIAELTARVAVLEARPAIQYAGVWRPGQKYPRGMAITHDGCLWVAEHDTIDERPGNGPTAWRLAVKRGEVDGNGAPPRAQRFSTQPRSDGLGR
jgi:hypothetical protein